MPSVIAFTGLKLPQSSADLLVNEPLVARGEVVAIDENFGVRVTELIEKP